MEAKRANIPVGKHTRQLLGQSARRRLKESSPGGTGQQARRIKRAPELRIA
jgi:hypothetical protein